MTHQEEFPFEQLPLELQSAIIVFAQKFGDRRTIANLRLVAKFWLAVVQENPGSLKIRGAENLEQLHTVMPNMHNLAISRIHCSVLDLHALEQCTQLTFLDLTALPKDRWSLRPTRSCKIANLPSSLQHMQTVWVNLSADSFVDARRLTNLHYKGRSSWAWMPELQNLQVGYAQSFLIMS